MANNNNGTRGAGSPNPVVYGRDLMNQMLGNQALIKSAHQQNMDAHNGTQTLIREGHQANLRAHNATQYTVREDGRMTRQAVENGVTEMKNHVSDIFGGKKPLWWLIVCIFGAIIFAILVYWYFEMSGCVHLESLGYWDYLRDAAGNAINDVTDQWIVDPGMKPVVAIGGAIVSGSLWTLLYNVIPFKKGGAN